MKYELHPACSAWPTMKPEELRELANDITANGLRDPVTLTPDGLLLDGRNRALACEMASVEPTTMSFSGDPWLFSLSRNKHRRHLTTDQIALIAARLATRAVGRPKLEIASNEAIKNAEAAKAAGVPKTAIDSAKVVLEHGTSEEREAVESGKAPVRKTADRIRARRRATAEADRPGPRPATPPGKKALVHNRDPIDDLTRELITKCAGPKGEWRTLDRMSSITHRAGEERGQTGAGAPWRRREDARGRQGRPAFDRGRPRRAAHPSGVDDGTAGPERPRLQRRDRQPAPKRRSARQAG